MEVQCFQSFILFYSFVNLEDGDPKIENRWGLRRVFTKVTKVLKPTLGPPKKFQHLTRAEEVVIADFELAIPRPPNPISCPEDRQLVVTIVVKH